MCTDHGVSIFGHIEWRPLLGALETSWDVTGFNPADMDKWCAVHNNLYLLLSQFYIYCDTTSVKFRNLPNNTLLFISWTEKKYKSLKFPFNENAKDLEPLQGGH